MEITNEVKAKVLAQYLGQISLTNKESYIDLVPGKLIQVDISTCELVTDGEGGYYLSDITNTKLILKPLSVIINEDAIEVAKKLGVPLIHPGSKTPASDQFLIGKGVEFLLNKFANESYKSIDIFNAFQFLQSRGYDLPQYLLGGKTLFECDLAIYK